MIEKFLAFSADVTAFTVFELQGTGQAEAYFATVSDVVGSELVDQLLDAYDRVCSEEHADRDFRLRREIFGDEKLGPVARNIIRLWYVGIWYQLPRAWTEAFGAREKDVTFMVSAAAYTEGLLWPAIGAHPTGAKTPGYGSWASRSADPSGMSISSKPVSSSLEPQWEGIHDEHCDPITRCTEGVARYHANALVE